jgi:hypothetical protein
VADVRVPIRRGIGGNTNGDPTLSPTSFRDLIARRYEGME